MHATPRLGRPHLVWLIAVVVIAAAALAAATGQLPFLQHRPAGSTATLTAPPPAGAGGQPADPLPPRGFPATTGTAPTGRGFTTPTSSGSTTASQPLLGMVTGGAPALTTSTTSTTSTTTTQRTATTNTAGSTGASTGGTTVLTTTPQPPAPQGAQPVSGCTVSGTSATCELFAAPGSIVLPGQPAPVPIWGFSGSATAPVTTPGPVLTVDAGTTVTVHVHNGLSAPLSLAIPQLSGLKPDQVGAAPGAVASYTFLAGRPGSYLYEAGHTADGARQAAMGLVGALVVRGSQVATATGSSPSLLGTAASAYDDESVLVLSEIDPALAANPATFDMRQFNPTYRLINGKAYPETAHIATDVGRKVLLRYVNAGTSSHTMGLLGTTQTVLADDAQPVAYPLPVVAQRVSAGESVDAVVSVPAAPDGVKYALYETAGRLSIGSQTFGTGGQLAFGGMLTYLDTQAAPPSPDRVGPVASKVTASPAVAKITDPLTVSADFSDVRNGNSAVVQAEYVFDTLTIAEGSGTAFDLTGFTAGPTLAGVKATVDLRTVTPALAEGRHTVYVRAKDAAGNWGPVGSAAFTLAISGPATTAALATPNPTNGTGPVSLSATADDSAFGGTITQGEYFIDTVGKPGEGQDLKFAEGQTVTAVVATIPARRMSRLTEGHHTVYLRTRDSLGLWGPLATIDLVVDQSGPVMTVGAVTPSPNNGTLGSSVDSTMLKVEGTFTDPTVAGVHSTVVAAEGFVDTAGPPGTGFSFYPASGSWDATTVSGYGLIPLSEFTALADGVHQVWVRAQDAAGNWGALSPLTLQVDRTAPTVSGLTAAVTSSATTTSLNLKATGSDTASAISNAEWFDGGDPGAGNGKPMTVTATGPTTADVTATVDLTHGFVPGPHRLSVRVRDVAGNWSAAASTVVTIKATNLIFSDGFDRGNLAAWTAHLGLVDVTEAAALAGPYGLAVTGYGNRLPSYVVTASPTAEPSYQARFGFRAGSLTNPGTVNLFAGRTITGGNAVVVQYSTGSGSPSVRLGVLAAGGMRYSTWSALPAGSVSLEVAWSSGPTGGAQLLLNRAVVGSLTGLDTSASLVETGWLGLSGATGASSGTASFDSFISARYRLP